MLKKYVQKKLKSVSLIKTLGIPVQVGAVLARQQQTLDAHRHAYLDECGGTLEKNVQMLQAAKTQHQQSVQRITELNAAAEAQAHGEWEKACAEVAEYNAPRLAQLSVEADVLRAREDVTAFSASLSKYEKYLKEHGRTYNANAQVELSRQLYLVLTLTLTARRRPSTRGKHERCFERARDARTTPVLAGGGVGVLYLKFVKGYKFESILYVTQLRCAQHRAERKAWHVAGVLPLSMAAAWAVY